MSAADASLSSSSTESLTPRVVDARMERDLTLPRLRRAIPRDCLVISPWRAWGTVARVLLCVALCAAALGLVRPALADPIALAWQVPLLITLWILYGWVLVGLFVLGHDCGHRTFSRRRWVNTVMGHACLAPLANGYHAWRLTHDHHHAYTQLRGQDVDWASYLVTREEFTSRAPPPSRVTRIGYALPFGTFFWIWWNSLERAVAIRRQLAPRVWQRERYRLRRSSLATAGVLLAIYGTLWYAVGFWGMLKYYGIPAWIAMVTGWVIIAIQHANEESLIYDESGWTPAKGQVVSTFDTRFPLWMEWLWCGINFHIPHHVAPAIPWYHLERAGRALRAAYPDRYQERRFGWRDVMAFRRTPFLERDRNGYYVLVPR